MRDEYMHKCSFRTHFTAASTHAHAHTFVYASRSCWCHAVTPKMTLVTLQPSSSCSITTLHTSHVLRVPFQAMLQPSSSFSVLSAAALHAGAKTLTPKIRSLSIKRCCCCRYMEVTRKYASVLRVGIAGVFVCACACACV